MIAVSEKLRGQDFQCQSHSGKVKGQSATKRDHCIHTLFKMSVYTDYEMPSPSLFKFKFSSFNKDFLQDLLISADNALEEKPLFSFKDLLGETHSISFLALGKVLYCVETKLYQ